MKALFTLLTLTLLIPGLAMGITRTVKLDGSGDYTSIQAALNAAQSGDTILVYPGRYYENLRIQTDNLNLISLEAQTNNPAYVDSTIIDGNRTSAAISVTLSRQNILIRGFSLVNGLGTGLSVWPSSLSVVNCDIFSNIASNGGGIVIGGATVLLSGVRIHDNYSLNLGGGIYASTASGYVNNITFDPVNRCSIYNNRSGSGQDIYVQNATSNLNVFLNTFSVAVPTTYYAIFLPEDDADYQMTFDIQNAHHQEINQDIYVAPDGDDNNDGLSQHTPLKTIHEGIYRIAADSLNQKTVHLLPGTYSRTDNDQIYPIALKSWVKVQGSGIDSTEVVGEPHPMIPFVYGFADAVFRTHPQYKVYLYDFSMTSQNTGNSCAIDAYTMGSLNLNNVRIHNISPDIAAALMINYSANTHWEKLIVENIETSDMGLVYADGYISGQITNCVFKDAISSFVSASVWAAPLIWITGDSELVFDNCEFSSLTMSDNDSNAIQIGAVQYPQQQNNFSFNNCLFSNNTSQGGVMLVSSKNNPNISFTNCTFAGNEGDAYTLMVNGNVNITNSIFYNDTPYQIKANPMTGSNEPTTLNIDYSCIKDGLAGIQQAPGNTINYSDNNISGNPLFAGGNDIHDPLYYSLSELSPCINTGTPDASGLELLPYDLAGNWRIWDGRIDMGCFEYGSVPWVSTDDPVVPQPEGCLLYQNYPNPFNPSTTIRYSLDKPGPVSLEIYNLKGQLVKSLYSGVQDMGSNQVIWNGTDTKGSACSSGVYFYRLRTSDKTLVRKMLMLK